MIPPLVGGGILSCDDEDDDAGTTAFWEPAGADNKIQNDTKFAQIRFSIVWINGIEWFRCFVYVFIVIYMYIFEIYRYYIAFSLFIF